MLHKHIGEMGTVDVSADTLVRFQSWLFAIISVLDNLVRVARTITQDTHRRTTRLSLLELKP